MDKFSGASEDFSLSELTTISEDTLVAGHEGTSGAPLNSHDAISFGDAMSLQDMGFGGSGGDWSGQSIPGSRVRRNDEWYNGSQ